MEEEEEREQREMQPTDVVEALVKGMQHPERRHLVGAEAWASLRLTDQSCPSCTGRAEALVLRLPLWLAGRHIAAAEPSLSAAEPRVRVWQLWSQDPGRG